MITVYYQKVDLFLEEEAFRNFLESAIEKIEKRRREKILRMHRREEQIRSLSAGLLLHGALCEQLGLCAEPTPAFELGYGENGKPFLKDYRELYFNLSHSGDYVALALGESPSGVDIQEKTRVREGIARRFFTEADNCRLSECGEMERRDLFFRMWSIKESYVKLTGKGISEGLSGFEIDWERKALYEGAHADRGGDSPAAYFMENGEIEEYSLSLCFYEQDQEVVWKQVPGGIWG